MSTELGFIDPTANRPDRLVNLAERPISLNGKVIGLLDNTKEQADVILSTIGEALCERYGIISSSLAHSNIDGVLSQ